VSKFDLNVCLPPTPPEKVRTALAAAMAPFDANSAVGGNPDGEWDWWRIDAGDERFAVDPAHDGDPRLIHEPSPGGRPRDPAPLRCDGGPRGLLDLRATRAGAVSRARARIEAERADFARLVADHPPARPLTVFLARHSADPVHYPRDHAVADHHAQPLVRALNNRTAWERYPNLGMWVLGPDSDPISHFTRDPRPELEVAASWAFVATALLTLDGRWVESDRPGPFGAPLPGETPSAAYARQAAAYLDGLDGECVIVRLLCHC
jgi:hypothetical protein